MKTKLFDQFNRPIRAQGFSGGNRFLSSANASDRTRVPRPYWVRRTAAMLPDCDRQVTVGLSNWLYWNTYIGGIIDERAADCVGDAWDLQYLGEKKAWGAQAEDWFFNHGKVCDIAGRLQWRDFLKLAVIERHRDGDGFRLLTATGTDYPAQQGIPSTKVGENGSSKNYGGVAVDAAGRPLSFDVTVDDATLGNGRTRTEAVPANSLHQIFDPKHVDQYRGLPSLTRGSQTLQNQTDTEEFEQVAAKMASSIGLLRRTGGTGADDLLTEDESDPNLKTLPLFDLDAGAMPVLPPGYDYESFHNNRPGDRFLPHVNYMARVVLLGMGVPYEYAFNPETLTGPAMRFIMLKAARQIADDQVILERYAFRYYAYAISKAAKLKLVPKPPADWWNVTFSKPRQPSIDLGRDALADQNDFRLGNKLRRQHLIERQQDPDAFRRQKKAEVAALFEDAQEIATANGVDITVALKYFEDRSNALVNASPDNSTPAKQ